MRRDGLGSRLIPLSALVVGGSLLALAFLICIFAFDSFVASLNRDGDTLLDEAQAAIAKSDARSNAIAAADLIAPRLFRRSLIAVFVDDRHRVTVYFRPHEPKRARPHVEVRDRADRTAEPADRGWLARLILGSAAIGGLAVDRAQVGTLEVYVKDNDAIFVSSIERFVPLLVVALAAIAVLAFVGGSIINRQVLRPLVEVTDALERLAVGDLKSQLVLTNSRGQLGRLAAAYNGAVSQVESALAERDHANSSIRQFIADAGHQLRTPLTVIRGFIAILEESAGESPAERRHILSVMRQQSWLIGTLIENLILLDQWEQARPLASRSPVDVTQLVEDIVGALADVNPSRSLTVEHAATRDCLVAIDPHELTYAVTNLVDNALKYTTGSIEVTIRSAGDAIAIAVADRGPGMVATVAAHAFDRFYRGDRRDVDGSGLGLAIAKRAIERGGGSITLETRPERGSTVTIALPPA